MEIRNNFSDTVRNIKETTRSEDPKGKIGPAVSDAARSKGAGVTTEANETAAAQEITLEAPADVVQNKLIIESTIAQTYVDDPGKSLTLTLSSMVEKINLALEPEMGPNAIQQGVAAGIDVSPEATADRIVSMSTAAFSRYQDANPDLSFDEQVNRFVDVIQGGIEQGFAEAREILDGMGVFDTEIGEQIAANIDKTFDLVLEGLERFRTELTSPQVEESSEATSQAGDSVDGDTTTLLSSSTDAS